MNQSRRTWNCPCTPSSFHSFLHYFFHSLDRMATAWTGQSRLSLLMCTGWNKVSTSSKPANYKPGQQVRVVLSPASFVWDWGRLALRERLLLSTLSTILSPFWVKRLWWIHNDDGLTTLHNCRCPAFSVFPSALSPYWSTHIRENRFSEASSLAPLFVDQHLVIWSVDLCCYTHIFFQRVLFYFHQTSQKNKYKVT